MRLFLRETRSMFVNSTLEADGDDLWVDLHDADVLNDLLVFSLLGRHLAEEVGATDVTRGTVFLYEYDIQKQTMVLRRPLCVYQRDIYGVLLVLTTVILLAGVALRVNEKRRESAGVPMVWSATKQNGLFGSTSDAGEASFTLRLPGSTGVRYRALPQQA